MSIGYNREASEGNDSKVQSHMVGENSLSVNQLCFRKSRSTVDAIQAVVDIATEARRGSDKRKEFCALNSMDIHNAFNTARWMKCIEAMMPKKVPDYLVRMIDDYLRASLASQMTHFSCAPLKTSES